MRVPESRPAGTGMKPEPFSPGRAAADPMRSVPDCWADVRAGPGATTTRTVTSVAKDRMGAPWAVGWRTLIYDACVWRAAALVPSLAFHDRLAADPARHQPRAPDAAARHPGDDHRAVADAPHRAGAGVPPRARPMGPLPLAQRSDVRLGGGGRRDRRPDVVPGRAGAGHVPRAAVSRARHRPERPRVKPRRVGVHHLAPPLRGGGSGPDRLEIGRAHV